MKKNISINLQGLIFHIEEDGYEQLRQYLAAIKVYFSSYEGHEEIVADIEGRMAEVFSGKLTPGKQVITQEDVQALIAQMGSVQDFAQLEDEDLHQPYPNGTGTGTYASTATRQQRRTRTTGEPGAKRLFRDVNRKVIGGVSAGIAQYLGVDAVWIRLIFAFFFVLGVFTAGISAGFIALIYILCWIALPKSYTATEVSTRKLFRDPDDKKLGGVCSGLALYFGTDVAVVRLIFLVAVLFGGLGLPVYVVLWLVVPLATTITDKVQMQGNPLTLTGIEDSLKNNLRLRDEDGRESDLARVLLFPVRLIAQVLEVLAKALRPFLSFLGSAIRILAGIFLLVLALSFIFALFMLLGAGTGLWSGDPFMHGPLDGPLQLFTRDFPAYGMFAGFVAGLIPSLFLLMVAVGLLTKRFFLRPLVGWSLFAVWVVSLFAVGSAIFVFQQNFNEQGEYITEKTYETAAQTILLNGRNANSPMERWVNNVEFESITGPNIRVVQEFRAKGRTEEDAIRNAQMLTYRIQQRDSTFTFDRQARLNQDAAFRDQELLLKIYLPQNKKFRMDREFTYMAHNYFDQDYDLDNINLKTAVWELRDGKFYCPQCPSVVSEEDEANENEGESEASTTDEANFTPDIDINLNLPEESSLREWHEYGPEEKTFNFSDFNGVEVGGAYHVRLKKGEAFAVRARGNQEDLGNLRVSQSGDILKLESDEDLDFWDFTRKDREIVLVEITMPRLERVDFSGAIQSEIAGFEENYLRISESGAVQLTAAVNADRLELDLSGAAKTTLKGHADVLEVDASGACNIQAADFSVSSAELDLSGASKADIYVTNELNANASGVSNIRYRGNPGTVTTDVSGASKVRKAD